MFWILLANSPARCPQYFLIMYLQAHHLDLEFYDKFCKPGSSIPKAMPVILIVGTLRINKFR